MTNKISDNNEVSIPKLTYLSEAKALRCLKVLLNGGVLNRKTTSELGIAAKNDSVHSLISILRNKKYIPVISIPTSDRTCDYIMAPEEIVRYRDPKLRKQQYREMEAHVQNKRQEKIAERFLKFLLGLTESKNPWVHFPNLPIVLKDIQREINALLEQEKR